MPNLSIFLNTKFSSIQNQLWNCDICNESFTKKLSLTNHKRKHKLVGKVGTPLSSNKMEQIELCVQVENQIVSSGIANGLVKSNKKNKPPDIIIETTETETE